MSCKYDKLAWKFLFGSIALVLISVILSFLEYRIFGMVVTAVSALLCLTGLYLSFKEEKDGKLSKKVLNEE